MKWNKTSSTESQSTVNKARALAWHALCAITAAAEGLVSSLLWSEIRKSPQHRSKRLNCWMYRCYITTISYFYICYKRKSLSQKIMIIIIILDTRKALWGVFQATNQWKPLYLYNIILRSSFASFFPGAGCRQEKYMEHAIACTCRLVS